MEMYSAGTRVRMRMHYHRTRFTMLEQMHIGAHVTQPLALGTRAVVIWIGFRN